MATSLEETVVLNNKGQLGVYETIIIFVLLGCVAGLGYLYIHKPTESQIYQNGSKPEVVQPDIHPNFGGCVDVKVEEWKDGLTNKIVR